MLKKYTQKEFIFVEPHIYKPGSYSFNKIQNIINNFKDKIDFIQISHSQFSNRNATSYIDKFTFRKSILYASYSKFYL